MRGVRIVAVLFKGLPALPDAVALALTLSWKEIPLRAHPVRAEPTAEL